MFVGFRPDEFSRPNYIDGFEEVEIPLDAELEVTNQIATYKRVDHRIDQPPFPDRGNALPCTGDSGGPLFLEVKL